MWQAGVCRFDPPYILKMPYLRPGARRMAFTLNDASAVVTLSMGDAAARVTPGSRAAIGNLTKGFDLAGIEDRGEQPGPAWSATGNVQGSGVPDGWDFGYVQLCKQHAGQVFYAGRIRSEGSIIVSFDKAMPAALMLDSLSDRSPWTINQGRFTKAGGKITMPTGDHPAIKVPLKLRNSGRNVDNFLFQLIDDREFWTIMTAIDPKGKQHNLLHFNWRVQYNCMFSWMAGKPVPKDSSKFTLVGQGKGAPKDGELQGLISAPVPPQFNEAAGTAIKVSLLGARGPNRTEQDTWFLNVPPTFFT
jgi:hypothetical protein